MHGEQKCVTPSTLRGRKAEIGRRLKEARERVNASLEEAADAADVQVTAIKAWERGRTLPCLLEFRGLLGLYGGTGYQILFGANPFEISDDEARELSRIVRQHGSPQLAFRVGLMLATVGRSVSGRSTMTPIVPGSSAAPGSGSPGA